MTRFRLVRNLIKDTEITQRQTLGAICMFGIIGIIGTHTGIVYDVSTGGYSNWALNI
jgi:LytS/YehU family sensor histidine kinase